MLQFASRSVQGTDFFRIVITLDLCVDLNNELCVAIHAAMPQAEEVEDEGTLGNAQALLDKWFSNAKTVVVTTQG